MDKGQIMRFSKAELALIRQSFKEESVLLELRNIFFGFSNQSISYTPTQLELIEKMFIPDLSPEVPIGQQTDILYSLQNLKEIPPEVAEIHLTAQFKAEEYLKKRFSVLRGFKDDSKVVDFRSGKIEDVLAYKFLVNSYIDNRVNDLKVLANTTEETLEEARKKALSNSSK
jgi:hypothetical protein